MPGQPEEDARLIARIAERDRSAMDALVRRYASRLFRFAKSAAGGDAALAEDAVQESFVSIWRSAQGFRGAHPRAWIFTIARNAVRAEARRRGRVEEAKEHDVEEVSLDAAGFASPNKARSFEQAVESRERVEKALSLLAEHEREVIGLVDVNELSVEEAAHALEVSGAATKSRLHRARLRLMSILTAQELP